MKNKAKDIILGIIALITVVFSAVSCDHKDLCYYHPHVAPVKIKVDWEKANGKDIDGMTAYLFAKQDDQQTINTTITTHQVNEIKFDLLQGKYDVAVFNGTPEEYTTLQFFDLTDYNDASVQAAEISVPEWYTKYNVKSNDKYIAYQPEWIARGYSQDITVTQEMVELAEEEYINNGFTLASRTVTLVDEVVPDTLTCRFHVKIELTGIDNYYQSRAVITGMSLGKHIFSMDPLNETVSHYAGLEVWKLVSGTLSSDNKGVVEGDIVCFGLPKGKEGTLSAEDVKITIEILLVDKKTIITAEAPLNIGHLIRRDSLSNNLYMTEAIVFPIELPYVKPEDGTEGGFGIGLDDWEKEEIEILKH